MGAGFYDSKIFHSMVNPTHSVGFSSAEMMVDGTSFPDTIDVSVPMCVLNAHFLLQRAGKTLLPKAATVENVTQNSIKRGTTFSVSI